MYNNYLQTDGFVLPSHFDMHPLISPVFSIADSVVLLQVNLFRKQCFVSVFLSQFQGV